MDKELSLIIPTYNEKENLKILLPRVLDVFRKNNIHGEIIIVDDRSNDGSFEYLTEQARLIPQLKVMFRTPPPSLSRAWFEGFAAATKTNIASMDADLCYDPEVLPLMLEKMDEFDIVVGSRYVDRRFTAMKGKPLVSAAISILGQFIARLVTGITVRDTSSGFRMFKKDLFERIRGTLKVEGNTFLIEFLYRATKAGAKATEIQIEYGERIHGTSKLKFSRESRRYMKFILDTLLGR